MKRIFLRNTARILLLSFTYQLVLPLSANALTTGPSQPEVQSFEPVGTTEMVDMFTGDFTYNIPLLDIEGYPVNIAYHSGVGIEQEASWVGLGWNINPGEINRGIRGLPDDFNGEKIEKKIKINEETEWRVGTGGSVSFEAFGWDSKKYGINLSLGVGGYMAFNNYKGMSVGMNTSATISVPFASTGINMGIGSQNGADIDVNAGLHVSKVVENDAGSGANAGIGVSGATGFNSRSGMKALSFGVNTSVTVNLKEKNKKGEVVKSASTNLPGHSFGSTVPIGLQNYVPVISNPGVLESFEFQARFGGELFYTYPNVYMSIQKTTMKYEPDGSKNAYGYLYAENAPKDGIMDFSRDNDGYYNNTMNNLPLASMTYDVYSVTGQGTGGTFRPFRNDIGSVFDPEVKSPKHTNKSVLMEAGIGNLFEVGTDLTFFDNEANSGPWERLNFRGNEQGSLYEKVFFKQGGELTYNYQQETSLANDEAVYIKEDMSTLIGKGKANKGSLPAKFGNANIYWNNGQIDRTSRSNLISYLTAEEATIPEIAEYSKIRQFEQFGVGSSSTDFYDPNAPTLVDRHSDKAYDLNPHQISEITQTLGDGRRYVYGIPALNHMTREITFSVNGSNADINTGLVGSVSSAQLTGAASGVSKDDFYSSTSTPAYAHSYLLTSVLSADYMDILGDGPSDDDIGGWVKFNYTLWDNDYRWRTPYETDKAQYNPGFWSDEDDDKGSVVIGSRQQWHIRSIESKNYIAEFYVSERHDGKGAETAVLDSSSTYDVTGLDLKSARSASSSYKLDSIKLFNKHSRYINTSNAVPIKTIIFKYKEPSSSLCTGIPNASSTSDGKLTLDKIYVKYGSSQKNLLSPYKFTYDNYDNSKHGYDFANKDRWGNFKDNSDDPDLTNYEFPYTKQDGVDLDADAAPYELTSIQLPSGGIINVSYESDDYSFVQDRRTMQMFKITGVGNSDKKDSKSVLYEDLGHVNDFVYFKRIREKENPNLSIRDNYLEGAQELYYSFNMDITGSGKKEFVKGYATILAVDSCSDDGDYGYVQLKKEKPGGKSNDLLHPATIYGINLARHYIPQKIYPGFNSGGGAINILNGLLASADEMLSISKNPVVRFVEKKKVGKNINVSKSWIRLFRPGLTKKGGGVRVTQLTLSDEWNSLSGNIDAEYGQTYDYSIYDDRYGNISSGVASYEPIIGGDENPFKLPMKYTAEANKLLPAIEFFQEEPFGESFFPPPVVGYSKIRVKSIHIDEGRSSQSVQEYNFYTAKEFPIEVDYTEKEAPNPIKEKKLRRKSEEVRAYQGYALRFNDMHGKAKSIRNYVINTDGTNYKEILVSSLKYKYQQDALGKLDNNVTVLYRKRGTKNDYEIGTKTLGEEIDFTVDTRERYNRSYRQNIDMNLNVVLFGVFPVPIPTSFFPDKEEVQTFRSMVSTKIIQRYGILKSVETFDHGATTTVENMIYDGETGDVLLTKRNNNFNDDIYDLKYPAYWAYERMGPAYTNVGFEIKADSLKIEDRQSLTPSYHGLLYVDKDNFYPGDELLLTYKVGSNSYQAKAWVLYQHTPTDAIDTRPTPYVRPIFGSLDTVNIKNHIRIALRASKDNSGNERWDGFGEGDLVTDVSAKVIRSGRRNNLDKSVQQVQMTQDPSSGGISGLLSANTSAFDKILNTTVFQYDDFSRPAGHPHGDSLAYVDGYVSSDYEPEIYAVNISTTGLKDYNSFVLGHEGNFRQKSQHTYITNRDYSQNNIRYDGTFSTKLYPFWSNQNNSGEGKNILALDLSNMYYWKQLSNTSYDVFGNAIEELDATKKYNAAQYGYNKTLPKAVTSNAKQRSSSHESFEDFTMLSPKNMYGLYKGTYYYHSPFAKVFNNVDAGNLILNGYGQEYYKTLNLVEGSDTITATTSHTGKYSLRLNSSYTYTINAIDGIVDIAGSGSGPFNEVRNFSFDKNKQTVVSMWIKPASGANPATLASSMYYEITLDCATAPSSLGYFYPFQVKSGNIDGWYLVSGIVDLRGLNGACLIRVTLPGNAYYDDVRFVPLGSHMKSYVYDPVTFKLTAELDENNFATFYEYDQEGLLVRVKKETDRGIVTISESRRSNTKTQ